MNTKPLVSIICLTYNEENFVRETLDNFLSQKTSFPYEVLVYDDASQDHTPDILKDYAAKYPNIFRLTLYTENNFQKGLGFLGLREGFNEAQGKYIAYCEGDDYWCDNEKLQKQVDFLESHPEYVICANETRLRNDRFEKQDGILFSQFNKNLFIPVNKSDYSFKDTLTGNIFHISGLMFRNTEPIVWPRWINTVSACDMVMYMILGQRGKIHRISDVMSVYRDHSISLTSSRTEYFSSAAFIHLSIHILRLMNHFWNREYQALIYPLISRYYVSIAFTYVKRRKFDKGNIKYYLKRAWQYDKLSCSKYLMKDCLHKIFKVNQ